MGGSPGSGGSPSRFVPLGAEGGWAAVRRGPHAPACSLPPAGVPSGGAVPRAQTHRAEALQRVPRAAQAGEAAPPPDSPPRAPAPPGRRASELRSPPLPPLLPLRPRSAQVLGAGLPAGRGRTSMPCAHPRASAGVGSSLAPAPTTFTRVHPRVEPEVLGTRREWEAGEGAAFARVK